MDWRGCNGRGFFQHGEAAWPQDGYRWAITADYTSIFIRHI